MLHRARYVVLLAAVAVACGDPSPTADAASPEDVTDVAPDVAADDVTDAASDVALDVARDVATDAVRDVAADVTRDAAPDALRDAAPDLAVDAARDVVIMDASRDVTPTCTGEAPLCVAGSAGGTCGDVVTPAMCTGGAWRCAAGQVFLSECRCAGRPPGSMCACGPTGWVCPDAGMDVAVDVGCIGRPAACVSGTAGGLCGDALTSPTCVAGAWTCGRGMVFTTECACLGLPPRGCTCGSTGWACPDAGADVTSDGGAAGTLCGSNSDCAGGLLCCYPCGIPGCMNRCTAPMGGRCPLFP